MLCPEDYESIGQWRKQLRPVTIPYENLLIPNDHSHLCISNYFIDGMQIKLC